MQIPLHLVPPASGDTSPGGEWNSLVPPLYEEETEVTNKYSTWILDKSFQHPQNNVVLKIVLVVIDEE